METKERTVSYPREWWSETFVNSKGNQSYSRTCSTLTIPPYTAFYEKCTPNTKGYGSRSDWKPFQHYKTCMSKAPASRWKCITSYGAQDYPASYNRVTITKPRFGYELEYDYSASQPFGDMGKLNSDLPIFIQAPDGSGNFIPAPSQLNSWLTMALSAMMPTIKARLSLPNSVYELRDFRRPLETMIRTMQDPRMFSRRFMRVSREKGFYSLRNIVRVVAGNYLQWMFNLSPLVSDIAAVHAAMTSTSVRIKRLIAQEGRLQTHHFTRAFEEFPTVPPSISNSGCLIAPTGWNSFTVKVERSVVNEPSVFHVQVQYNYMYNELQRTCAQLLGHLDALGVNLNPAIIWNAIPWSFIVDWTLGVSRFLNEMKVENMKPRINILRSLWSIKRKRVMTCRTYTASPPPFEGYQSVTLPSVIETAYRRDVAFVTESSLLASGLSSTEISLGAALVLSRRRHSQPAWHRRSR